MNCLIKLLDFCRVSFLFPLFLPAYNKSQQELCHSQAASLFLEPHHDCMGGMKTAAQCCDDWRQTFCCRLEFCVCIKIFWLLVCLCFLMHLRQTHERPSQKQLAESRCLTDERRAEWLFVLEAFPLQSAWLLAGWHSGFSYRPASWRSCIQFISRLRVEMAFINALTVILTQGFSHWGLFWQ